MSTFLARYLQGDHIKVWQELMNMGDTIYQSEYIDDATSVARTIVQRALQNIQVLIERLPKLGYQFGYDHLKKSPLEKQRFIKATHDDYEFFALLNPEDPTLLMNQVIYDMVEDEEWILAKPLLCKPAQSNSQELIATMETLFGQLPLILKAWYETIGEVNLYGIPPNSWLNASLKAKEGDVHGFDPLYIVSVEQILDLNRYALRADGYDIFLAPHELFKGNKDDQGGYAIHVPSSHFDCPLNGEWHHTTFVGYLRACFRWGGLPGLEGWEIPPEELRYLRNDLIPL